MGGATTDLTKNHYLTVDAVRKAVRFLKVITLPRSTATTPVSSTPTVSYDRCPTPNG